MIKHSARLFAIASLLVVGVVLGAAAKPTPVPVDLARVVPIATHAAKADVIAAYGDAQLEHVVPSSSRASHAAAPGLPPIEERSAPTSAALLPHQRESLRDRAHGVWYFFDDTEHVATIRIEAPFQGDVGGVKIGDTATSLVQKRGAPAKEWAFGPDTATLYDPGAHGVRYDVDPSGVVVRIFL